MITGTDGKQYDMRIQPAGVNWNGHTTTLMDPTKPLAWVTILNTSKNYLLGYVFKREANQFLKPHYRKGFAIPDSV